MKKYCVSLELAKEMKELGFEQESEFYWWIFNNGVSKLISKKIICQPHLENEAKYSAYTVGELGEMLPEYYSTFKVEDKYEGYNDDGEVLSSNITEANARASMLIYLKKKV